MTREIKIIDLDENSIDLTDKVISLGDFDGLHRGHMSLIDKNLEISKKFNLEPSVLFFKKNSKEVFQHLKYNLSSLEDKISMAFEKGISTFALVSFSDEFKNLSPYDFIKKILVDRLNAKYIVVGENFTFGLKSKGNVEYLKKLEEEFGYKTIIIPLRKENSDIISSTTIRTYLKDGFIDKANNLLGYNYKIKGKVISGEGRGRNLGYPTANLKLDFNYALPKNGVYFTKVFIDDKQYFAMTDIGTNPTFEDQEIKIESYIFDFNENIYGKKIILEFIEFVRDDVEFKNADELIDQLHFDYKNIREKIKNYKN
ncbi:MAG: bifunctional riboflavin kinase/FAD synthetase [Tissierellia bacterium]|nr:bifunctional riboflavin kinase/FAD synthetase [Tissierellia bacterium]